MHHYAIKLGSPFVVNQFQLNLYMQKGLNVTWDVDLYGELLKIGGGKER